MFAERLKTRRTALRITRSVLGKSAGVSARTIQNYEEGNSRPAPGILLNLAQALGVSVDWLNGTGEDPYVDEGIRMQEHLYFRGAKVGGSPGEKGVNVFEVGAPLVGLSPEILRLILRMVHVQNEKNGDEDFIPKTCRDVLADLADRDARIEKGIAMMEEDARNGAQGPQ